MRLGWRESLTALEADGHPPANSGSGLERFHYPEDRQLLTCVAKRRTLTNEYQRGDHGGGNGYTG